MRDHKVEWELTDKMTTIRPMGGGPYETPVYHIRCICGWEYKHKSHGTWLPVTSGGFGVQCEALNHWWDAHIRKELIYEDMVLTIEI